MEFKYPDFIIGETAENIHKRMMQRLPEDIDGMPGGFPYDLTMPTALEISELIQYVVVRTLMIMFPQYAWGDWLDLHGADSSTIRKSGTCAKGIVHVEGDLGIVIPAGTVFCTAATDAKGSVLFESDEDVVLEDGTANIPVTAVLSGKDGNVIAGSVVLAAKTISGVTLINNPNPITGGTDEEDDESYRDRILEELMFKKSMIGNDGDYVRWAKEVDGIGSAKVIPEWGGASTVKIVARDSNGDPANQALCTQIYNHIMRPDDALNRLAPTGVTLTVVGPTATSVTVVASVYAQNGYTAAGIASALAEKIKAYYAEAEDEGKLKFAKVSSLLVETEGVDDVSSITVNGGTATIPIAKDHYFSAPTVTVTIVEV